MSEKIEKLKGLLNELFRLDQPDLDFGIYRIMHARSEEITKYLDNGLLPQVKDAFEQYKSGDVEAIQNEIKIAIKGAKDAGFEPDESPKVIELRGKLADESIDLGSIENEVFDNLYNFFRRYYDKGDFLSKRVYKPGVYAIPYEGEEVKLHWANSDQYYVKTSEYLRNYSFCLQPDNGENPMRVNFELIDADEGEHGNIKEEDEKKRRFQLAPEPFFSFDNNELTIRFTHEIESKKQNKINDEIESSVLDLEDTKLAKWIERLKKPHTRKDGKQSDKTSLRTHIGGYTKRNNSDYFIHKDLDGFLRRELDFYIKNEVMHLDDIENETVPKVEQYLSKIKVIRSIATKVIQFLAQIENFQKKLWLKKKFVVETNYCITLDRVPEELYSEIVENEAQSDEWVNLFAIDEIRANLLHKGYSKPLTIEFLNTNKNLVLDTQFFDEQFKATLIDSFDSFDEQCEGLLIHSENFQAMTLINNKYKKQFNAIYLDPPYNTNASPIIYKNDYKDSAWLSMMADRLILSKELMCDDGVICLAIDDEEVSELRLLCKQHFPKVIGIVPVKTNPVGRKTTGKLTPVHEYSLFLGATNKSKPLKLLDGISETQKSRYPLVDGQGHYAWLNFRRSGNNDLRTDAPTMYYPIIINSKDCIRIPKMEYVSDVNGYNILESIGKDENIVYPNKGDVEKNWQRSWQRVKDELAKGLDEYRVNRYNGEISIQFKTRPDMDALPRTWFDAKKYASSTLGPKEIKKLFGKCDFDYPKSVSLVTDCVKISGMNNSNSMCLDPFSGSGTTGHSIINMLREGTEVNGYVLIEMGSHFDMILKPRLLKVIYSNEWKSGKPIERKSNFSHFFKYLRLESYDDTLNNLQLNRNDEQKSLFDFDESMADDEFKEQYLLNYMLELESAGCQSLLNISDFMTPNEYKMNIKRPGSVESNVTNVDLIETFNWLIGITVNHLSKPQFITAEFLQDGEGRLCVNGELQPAEEGAWWFRSITGTLPDGRQTLVIWRNRPGGEDTEGVERDNLMLNEWFSKQNFGGAEEVFNNVYVNGSNNLDLLKKPEDNWSVRMIEDDFFNLMFE